LQVANILVPCPVLVQMCLLSIKTKYVLYANVKNVMLVFAIY